MLPLDAQGSRTSSRLALTGATPLLVAAEKTTPAQGGKNYPPADGHALFIEAVNLFGAGRYEEAIVKFTAAYNSPTLEVHGLAANQIGTMYLNGKTVPHDGPLALKWLTRAAELHNHTAEHTLVQMYAVGQDAPKDDAKVAAYARASAEAGDPTGQIDYAICYEKGFGVPMQQGTAIYWLEKAAAQKSPVANLKIGVHFADGAGVNRDDNAARQYYNVALAESTDANLTRIINGNLQALDQRAASEQAAAAAQQAQAAQAQVASNQEQESTVVDNSARIAELQSDIEMQEADAARSEASANELASGSNCYGPGAPACQMIGNMGAAKERKDANRARNQADRDREEIQRLEGEQVEVHQRRTTSFGDTLTQTTQEHPTPTINDTLAQQQQALQDIAVAKQQQQQQQQRQQQQQQQQIALAARQQTLSPPAHTSPRPVRSVNTTPAPGPAAPATPYTPPSAQPNAGSASALSGLVAPRDNSCIFQSYDSSEYGWLALRNDCGESLHVTWKSMSLPTKIFAASDIAVGTSISSGLSHAEVQAAGGLLLFVCPVGYAPVTPSMKSVGDEPHVSRFSCQPQ